MTRSADDKRARFLEAQQHSPGVPAPPRGGSDDLPSAQERAGSGAAHRAAESSLPDVPAPPSSGDSRELGGNVDVDGQSSADSNEHR